MRTLRKMGYTDIQVARDGCEAIRLLLGGAEAAAAPPVVRPDLLLLDLRLPKVDGLEVLRQLYVGGLTRDVPVYILSSTEDPCDKDACTKLGARAVIPKPLTVEAFQRALALLPP